MLLRFKATSTQRQLEGCAKCLSQFVLCIDVAPLRGLEDRGLINKKEVLQVQQQNIRP